MASARQFHLLVIIKPLYRSIQDRSHWPIAPRLLGTFPLLWPSLWASPLLALKRVTKTWPLFLCLGSCLTFYLAVAQVFRSCTIYLSADRLVGWSRFPYLTHSYCHMTDRTETRRLLSILDHVVLSPHKAGFNRLCSSRSQMVLSCLDSSWRAGAELNTSTARDLMITKLNNHWVKPLGCKSPLIEVLPLR